MELSALTALSPLDGRYRDRVESLIPYFSEWALFKYRLTVEVNYFIALCEIPLPQLISFPKEKYETLRNLYNTFSEKDALEIKKIEKNINHDVKAVEYYLKQKLQALDLSDYVEFIHFGLTSQDVNNTAIPYSLKLASNTIVSPAIEKLIQQLTQLANQWVSIPMLAHTHGQAASPTTVGKELYVFVERLENQFKLFQSIPFTAKFGGATGNLNAHYIAYPNIDWIKFSNTFIHTQFGLERNHYSTQIEHYDTIATLCDSMKRIGTILIDLNRDLWQYISMNYFSQKINSNEVGSSAMPHKVNPIDFENSEGNLGIANALFEFLAAKLPISRLQRDLTDSTVLRNIGIPFGHFLVAVQSLQKGLYKIELNQKHIEKELNEHWEIIAEAIQTILRREKYTEPYEKIKSLTRKNEKITKDILHHFIDSLELKEEIKKELKQITPFNYIGYLKS